MPPPLAPLNETLVIQLTEGLLYYYPMRAHEQGLCDQSWCPDVYVCTKTNELGILVSGCVYIHVCVYKNQ